MEEYEENRLLGRRKGGIFERKMKDSCYKHATLCGYFTFQQLKRQKSSVPEKFLQESWICYNFLCVTLLDRLTYQGARLPPPSYTT